ncbi:hypothetical protein V7x_43450 [Crateriforma conspicua]|uniref:Uncharacterized protein n=1 Tax=Crateriforma conspicua TaxID=2527996 RepID=A0A5C6FKF9_9PLAN|nr:hypothetical protein [Crateriforma conspicua]TWU62610.1 hypothetical protein V7x_43450 [Crateriforma conspicua]
MSKPVRSRLFVASLSVVFFMGVYSQVSAQPPRIERISQARSEKSHTSPERYLAFQMFSGSSESPPGTTGESLHRIKSEPEMDAFFERLNAKIGHLGQPGSRLAVFIGPLTFDQSDNQLVEHIRSGFAMARKHKIAIGFHIDESKYWSSYKPFQNKPEILEWSDWEGTPSTGQHLNWGREFRLNPQLCLNHPLVKAESQRRARDVFAKTIAKGMKGLKQSNEAHLFAGIIIGWETALARDWETRQRTGYHALSNMGLSKKSSPEQVDKALAHLFEESLGIWASEFQNIGIPKEKLYSHIAFEAGVTAENFQQAKKVDDQTFSFFYGGGIPENAFVKWGRPGFSTYPDQECFRQIYTQLKEKKQIGWASSEGANVFLKMGGADKPTTTMESYLAYMFNHGATVVNVFGWDVGPQHNPFRQAAENPDAIVAYRKFLGGKTLAEEDLDKAYLSPAVLLRKKIPLMHKSIQAFAQRGGNMRKVQEKLSQFEPLLKQGKIDEAMKLVDEVLEITK